MTGFESPSIKHKIFIPKSCGAFLENLVGYGINKKNKRSNALNANIPLLDFYFTL